MKKFFIKTLGCKVNQIESAYLFEKLKETGFVPAEERDAEIFILNSCIVTQNAEKECRKIIKRWSKFSPEIIIITGCYPEVYKDDLLSWAQKQKIKLYPVSQDQKLKIPEILKNFASSQNLATLMKREERFFLVKEFTKHSRAFVKIQDGCDAFCSYCIVPFARGKPRSAPISHVLKQIEIFIHQGYHEFVLTGIHIGKWGKDIDYSLELTDLLWEIEKFLKPFKKDFIIRLSSIEPLEITGKFLDFAKTSEFLAPHFHIPLQSGSDKILKLMKRPYTQKDYLTLLEKLYKIFPHATFGTDVIVGFPQEEEKDFEKTLKVVENSPLNWGHIFPYSPRKGTSAYLLKERIPNKVVKQRKEILTKLFDKKREIFLNSEKGKIRRGIIQKIFEKEGFAEILSENYISCKLFWKDPDKQRLGQKNLIKLKFKEVIGKNLMLGEVL